MEVETKKQKVRTNFMKIKLEKKNAKQQQKVFLIKENSKIVRHFAITFSGLHANPKGSLYL